MGMDWHSSGITTSVLGALKRGPRRRSSASSACTSAAAAGAHSRQTPDELRALGERVGARRRRARAHQPARRQGRQRRGAGRLRAVPARLHRRRRRRVGGRAAGHERRAPAGAPLPLAVGRPGSFVDEPHAAIDGTAARRDREPDRPARRAAARGAGRLVARRARRGVAPLRCAALCDARASRRAAEDVARCAACTARSRRSPSAARTTSPSCCSTPGVGARTVVALPLVAEVVHGAPSRFTDPARFSLAHGGKDGHPFPVPLNVYDETIARPAPRRRRRAKLGERRAAGGDPAARRRGAPSRALGERASPENSPADRARRTEAGEFSGLTFDDFVEEERRASHRYGGMTVHGPAQAPPPKQLELPFARAR